MITHEDLDDALEEIDGLVRRKDVAALREAAVVLIDLFEAHFAHEEASPMFTAFPLQYPSIASAVAKLLREHEQMRREIRALADSSELEVDLGRLITKLDAHEKIEMALLEEALSRPPV